MIATPTFPDLSALVVDESLYIRRIVRDMLMLPDEIDAERHAEKLVDGCFDMLRYSPAMLKDED